MDVFDDKSSHYLANKRFFTEFLDRDQFDYSSLLARIIGNGQNRVILNLNDLRQYDSEQASRLVHSPLEYIAPFQSALREYIRTLPIPLHADGVVKNVDYSQFSLGFDGSFGSNRVSPRSLSAIHLGQLVCIEGIATRCSIVRPKVIKTVHFCPETRQHSEMSYHDATSLTGFPTSSMYPTKDIQGNILETEYGLSEYTDHQTLSIQELPERAPAGLLPSSVDVVLDADLVDLCKPGDRIAVVGIYRAMPSKSQGATSGLFRSVLIANHLFPLNKAHGALSSGQSLVTDVDADNIRMIAKRGDLFHLLARSIAPSIHGHEVIKQSLVLLLLGGVEKNLENGTHIRGDINMLMVGDPSTAKSQLLRFILNIAPLALNTTGRGSSGVGLTAAVTHDKETGERRLEAGAMVLADRGVVCIDEFDKMSDTDRVAIHEVMEQQTVTIAKAGIHMSLNARCSVVAAANPRYSHYDSTRSPAYNVNLPDSLLSRFDLLFIVLDTPDPENDRRISEKVINNHRYQRSVIDDEDNGFDENDQDNQQHGQTPIFQKFDRLLHGSLIYNADGNEQEDHNVHQAEKIELLSIPFMKKYFDFAKNNFVPILNDESSEFIGRAYAELRNNRVDKKESSYPVTARALETLIRLSSAHAKCRLSEIVEIQDCQTALQIMKFAIDHDTKIIKKQKYTQNNNRDQDEEEEKEFNNENDPNIINRQQQESTQENNENNKMNDKPHESMELTESSEPDISSISLTSQANQIEQFIVNDDRRKIFQRLFIQIMRHRYEIEFIELQQLINQQMTEDEQFERIELEAILQQLEEENKLMYRQGSIHRIV